MARPVSKSKVAKTTKPVSKKHAAAKADKIEKKIEEKTVQKEEKEEEDFQLPSDSDDDDDNENDNDSDESDDAEFKSDIQIHDDIIDSKSSSSVSTSNKSGHTIIKPSTESKKAVDVKTTKRGVIYVGRLPHGFEEKELKQYFQQFGEITRLRLSRNKKTGNSKHYAFIEFKESEVAKIAAETMDNYLLMGHLLKVSLLTADKIHEDLFKGANTKFKVIPYSKINQAKFEKKKSLEDWEAMNDKHIKNLKNKQESLRELGIDYNIDL